MAGPIPLHPSETFRYVLEANRSDDEAAQAVFECRTLTGRERHEISDDLYDTDAAAIGERTTLSGKQIKRVTRRCVLAALQGWDNVRNGAGPVPFPKGRDQILEILSPDDVLEIGMEIARRSGLWGSQKGEDAISD